jgi:hypothetical protein
VNLFSHFRVERSDRTLHDNVARDNVVTDATLNSPNRYDRRRNSEFGLSADYGLKPEHDLGSNHNWIHSIPGHGAVGLLAPHLNLQIIVPCHDTTWPEPNLASFKRQYVQAKNRIHLRLIQCSLFYHEFRTTYLVIG